jgi:hypothetical protein
MDAAQLTDKDTQVRVQDAHAHARWVVEVQGEDKGQGGSQGL